MNILLFISFFVFLFFVFNLLKTKNYLFFLPVFYCFINLYSIVGLYYFDFASNVPFDLNYSITNDDLLKTSHVYLYASLFFYFGVIVNKNIKISMLDIGGIISDKIYNQAEVYKVVIYLITCISLVFGYGLEPLVFRHGYIDLSYERNPLLLIIYVMTLPITSFLLAFLKNKCISLLLFIALSFLVFGTTARMILLIPVFYFIGSVIKYKKVYFIHFTLTVLFVFLLFTFCLQFRSNYEQGIIGNFNNLIQNGLNYNFFILGLNYLISFSFLVLSNVMKFFNGDVHALFISINPLPSSMLNINYMLSKQSLNLNAPFSAISILALSGYIVLGLYYFISAFIFSYITNYFLKKNSVFVIVIICLFFVFALFSVQYNLRGATRLIYYCIFILFCHKIFSIIKWNLSTKIGL